HIVLNALWADSSRRSPASRAHSAADRALCWLIFAPDMSLSHNPVCFLDRPSHGYQALFQYCPHLFGFAGSMEIEIPNPVMFQICTSPIQSMNPNSYRLTNNPMTMSCI